MKRYVDLTLEERRKYHRDYSKKRNVKEYQKKWRKEHKVLLNFWYKKYYRDADKKKEKRCRMLLNNAIRDGKIKRGKCIICGKDNTEGHHENYDKPFKVIWFCRIHHRLIHINK